MPSMVQTPVWGLGLILLGACGDVRPELDPEGISWSPESEGLRLGLRPELGDARPGRTPIWHLYLRNTSSRTVELGPVHSDTEWSEKEVAWSEDREGGEVWRVCRSFFEGGARLLLPGETRTEAFRAETLLYPYQAVRLVDLTVEFGARGQGPPGAWRGSLQVDGVPVRRTRGGWARTDDHGRDDWARREDLLGEFERRLPAFIETLKKGGSGVRWAVAAVERLGPRGAAARSELQRLRVDADPGLRQAIDDALESLAGRPAGPPRSP